MAQTCLGALFELRAQPREPALFLQRAHRQRLRGGGDRRLIGIARHAVEDAVLIVVFLAAGGDLLQFFERAFRAEHGQKIGDRLAALDVTYVLLAARHKFTEKFECREQFAVFLRAHAGGRDGANLRWIVRRNGLRQRYSGIS